MILILYNSSKKYYLSSLTVTIKRLWSFNHFVASASSNSSTNGPDWPLVIQQPTVKSGTVTKTQRFVSHSFSPRPPVVQQPAKTLASDFFFIWFPFGARSRDRSLKLTSNQPCCSLHQTVAAKRVSNANTTNYTTVTHTHGGVMLIVSGFGVATVGFGVNEWLEVLLYSISACKWCLIEHKTLLIKQVLVKFFFFSVLPILSSLSMATVSKALLIMGYSSSTSLKLSTESEYRRQ